MKIVFLDAATLGETPLDEIAALGELVAWPASTPAEALERVGDCDVLIVNKVRVTAELLDHAPRLRLVCESATGVNNIDLDACAARGIPVRNAAGYSTEAVVQSTFAHLLSLAGHAPYFDACVKSGRYSAGTLFCDISHPYTELAGTTLGIIGMGTIGARVAAVATAFGMRVIYYSTSGTSHNTDYPSVPLDTLLAQADAVSIARAGADETDRLAAQPGPRRHRGRSRPGAGRGRGTDRRRGAGRLRVRAAPGRQPAAQRAPS